MPKGWMYLLECSNGAYYTGSTKNLEVRLKQHRNGEGANFTKKHLPVKLVYYEEFERIDHAFYREKQVQGWSRKKKEALINGQHASLPELSKNYAQFGAPGSSVRKSSTSTGSVPGEGSVPMASTSSTKDTEPVDPVAEPVDPVAEPVEATVTSPDN